MNTTWNLLVPAPSSQLSSESHSGRITLPHQTVNRPTAQAAVFDTSQLNTPATAAATERPKSAKQR